jgi:hypothetical protein
MMTKLKTAAAIVALVLAAGPAAAAQGDFLVRLRAITNNHTEARIFVRGDRAINYGRVLEVMGAVAAAFADEGSVWIPALSAVGAGFAIGAKRWPCSL